MNGRSLQWSRCAIHQRLQADSSIAGLVALADLVFRSGTKYVKSYRDAPTEVGNLIREVKSLSVILHNLSLVAFGLEEIEPPEPTAAVHEPLPILQPYYLHHCHQLLRRLETGLSRTEASLDSGSGRQKLRARLKWPFTSTESMGMIQDIQRYNQIIHTALAADSLAKLKDCLTQQVEIKDDLQKINRTAEKILDIQVKIALDAKRNQVIKDFDQVNPRAEYETNNRLRHCLTGLWLTQGPEFDYWYSTPASRLWCSGIPGAGKSVLSAAVIKECLYRDAHDAHKAAAYFFCTCRHERSQHLVTILSSLCIQLALQSENAFQILQEYHDQLFSNHHLSTKPTAEILTQILHRICACFTRVYIIVDGIDECDNRVEANIKCLAELAMSQGDNTSLRQGWPGKRKEYRARREALSKLPPSLSATYDRILLRIDGYHDAVKRLVKGALLMLATSFSSLSFEEICEAISLEDGATTLEDDEIVKEEELLRWCSSLVRVNKSSSITGGKMKIQFAHFTVQEYLQSLKTRSSDHQYPQLRDYAVSRIDGVNFFSSLCLRFLTMEDMKRFPPTPDVTRSIGDMLAQRRRRTFYCKSVLTWTPYTTQPAKMGTSPLTSQLQSESIISLTLSFPEIFPNNFQIIIELLRAGVPITAHDVQLFRIRYDRCLQIRAFTSDSSLMWSLVPQFLKVLGENLTPGCPRFVLHQETADFILKASKIRQTQCPVGQSLDGASSEEVLKYFHSLIKLNDGIGMSAFLTTSRADVAKSTDIDPKRPGWNGLHLALLEKSYRVLDPLTVWHLAAEMNSVVLLKELLDLGNVNAALKITSKHHETPICAAATRLHLEAVSLLLPFCKTEEHWTSSKALSVILYEPRFSGVIQSLHGFGILSQMSCGMNALAYAFYRAILLDDVQTCEKLYGLGCPLECELPFPMLVTPLALAISQGSYKVMMWLFRKGAPVSTIMAHPTKDTHCTVLDLFLERPNLNSLLPTLLDVYLTERGSFAHEQRSILNIPLVSGNTDGLIIMLTKLQGKALSCGEVTRFFLDISGDFIFKSTLRLESLSAIINQKDICHQSRTPLFVAAAQNNVKAANALLIHGADVNATNDKNFTPLFVAVEQGAIEVVELLIGRGAHVDVMSTSSYGLLDVAFVQKSWRMVKILLKAGLSSKRKNVDGRNLLGLMTLWACQSDTKPNIGLFKQLLDHGVDLYVCDRVGSSASHYLFTRSCRGYLLCMLDMRLDLQVEKLSSWPDHFFSNGVDNLVGITNSLRYVKPSIGIGGVRQLCGLGTPGTHSLLCRAACWGSVTAIQNIIKLGINDLEHHCCEHGSPLNAAVHNRRWEAVKFLVLHGAKVPEDLWNPKNSTLSTASLDFVIREWLFFGRYTERKRISLDLLNDEPEIKSWSGVWVVRVPLQWRDRKCSVESTLEYAKRRHWLEIEYKSSTVRDTQLVRPKERRGSMSSVERQGYC
ncbi:heterokaryon incompatibility protein het-E-1 [Fusarium subglutinans]|uniref:Heterokaryon incompatibility protein het-E-1 n=1 Tax=Gibberella subglutinans TaxID=42677 RepID=A0A8H5Q789_GIBSU|nr:heterokaryon incompatibility protein het-E-1 [Fusarium subglutinans]KAF5609957.1 heterokaryon incompatibility protein het-E-1 [Fusarium subglutinans]